MEGRKKGYDVGWLPPQASGGDPTRFASPPLDGGVRESFFIEFRQESFGIMMMDCTVAFRR